MFTNYLKITIRNILKYKIYSFISIFGLSIGLASCMLILLFVLHELSFDHFHEKADRIYRIGMNYHIGTIHYDVAMTPSILAESLERTFPEVITSTRLFTNMYRGEFTYVKYKDRQFREEKFFYADSTFFDVFTVPLLTGDFKAALKHPNSVILTPPMVSKYFGDENPMGKLIKLEDGRLYKVTGIMQPLPSNSHFECDFLASFSSIPKSRDPEWYDFAVYTYIILEENASVERLDAKLPEFSRKYYEPIVQKIMGINYEEFINSGNKLGFFTQPLSDIHLRSNLDNDFETKGNQNTVIIFSAIALIILIVACINFINLSTARSSQRANEVGVRKVVGSNRSQLIWQFLAESIIVSTLSFVLALVFVKLSLPLFNNIAGTKLNLSGLISWKIIPGIILIIGIVGILAGSYPAFLFASFQPVTVLKGKFQTGISGKRFRNLLVVFQFATSIALFVGTIVIYNQLHYIKNKNLGFEKEHVVVIKSAQKLGNRQRVFKDRLKQHSQIASVCYSDCVPQILLELKAFKKEGVSGDESYSMLGTLTDYEFMDTYQLKLVEGRYFDLTRSTDSSAVILNQAAVKALNYDNPLDQRLILTGRNPKRYQIIGIFEDFHLESLHHSIRPFAAMLLDKQAAPLISLRVNPGDIQRTIQYLEKQWQQFVPEQPLQYEFFDDQFDQIYKSEIQASKIFSAFALLAIVVACLGLFGLATFTAEQRTKEIGIRKVLGASVAGIVLLISKHFAKWIAVSMIIAWPIAWYAMNKWLQNFAYRINMGWWIFLVAALLALVIALLTVSYQSLKAALANPVESLRYE